MKSGFRIGSILGIPLRIETSWFLILGLVTFYYGSVWQQENWGETWGWVAGLVMALMLFGSVLLHELGHSFVAMAQGIKVNSITLFLFGGVASIDQESKTPGQAFQVAIAGPSVSFGLFVALLLADFLLPLPDPAQRVVQELARINILLAVFNMIPGLPLDGGQVLKSIVWKLTGSRMKGVRWAARTGQLLGWTAILLGVMGYFTPFPLNSLWLALLGWFGVRNARAYSQVTDLQEALMNLDAATAMTRSFRVVDAEMSLTDFTQSYLEREVAHSEVYYASSDGRYRGLVAVEDLSAIERSQWENQTLHSIIHPLTEIPSVRESTPLTDVINRMEAEGVRRITVLSPAGAVAGVIDRGDVVQALAAKLKIPVPEALIKQIKEEGSYPPGLQIPALAKTATD
jgi:Zn-dependent protease/CBS domain-containing protein